MQAVLGGLKLSELKKRAQKVGVGVHELEEADDEPDTPKAVIALVLDSKCLILTVTPSILCALGACECIPPVFAASRLGLGSAQGCLALAFRWMRCRSGRILTRPHTLHVAPAAV